MKLAIKLLIALGVLTAGGFAARTPVQNWIKERNKIHYRTAKVEKGSIRDAIIATGEVKPVLSVQVGSFVSGPIIELHVDFNDMVTEGQLLAKIDPKIYEAAVARDRAALANRVADLQRVKAQLRRAERDFERASRLREENPDYISDSEMDRYRFDKLGLEAQVGVAMAGIDQAKANLLNSEANLGYTQITSPVDGMIVDRKIDPGQTLAASFQTPELFIIAPEMREKMHVFASIDETDIGRIRRTKAAEDADPTKKGRVRLSVEAYPDDIFEGRIEQVRMSSTVNQNVVTYPVVIAVSNPDLKLLPGMTADLTFVIQEKSDVIRIPNAALRFFPTDSKQVREQDRKLLDGTASQDTEDDQNTQTELTVEERVAASRQRTKRHVWVQDADLLKAVEVQVGISDNRYTELVSGDIPEGAELVLGVQKKK